MFIFLVSSPGVAKGEAMGTNRLCCGLCIVLVFLKVKQPKRKTSKMKGLCHISLIMPG